MMINDTIQELFEGSLADEQSAELFHVLSVSPERRVDFNTYVTMMAAMQRDRAASALTSDEDSEIWGILGGLGAATITTSAGSALWSWLGKGAALVAVGVIGYILGTTFTSNKTVTGGNGGNSIVTSGSKTITQATPPGAANAGTTNRETTSSGRSNAGTPANGISPAGASAPQVISAPAIASTASPASATSSRSATPTVLYRDRIVYRNSAPITSAADAAARRSWLASNTNSVKPSSPENGKEGGRSTTPPVMRNSPNSSIPANGSAIDSTKAPTVIASGSSIKPEDAMANMSQRNIPSPQEMMASALRRNGIEIGLNERTGVRILKPQGDDPAPVFSTHHLSISYHFGEGRFGLGARLGYGTFPLMTLSPSYSTRQNVGGETKVVETVYSLHPKLHTEEFTEFFTNYRMPLGDNLALCAEAAYGTSTSITKAGGDVYFLGFLTERVAVQLGGGISRYWYSVTDDVNPTLETASDGTSFTDNVKPGTGMIFELRYGILYHF